MRAAWLWLLGSAVVIARGSRSIRAGKTHARRSSCSLRIQHRDVDRSTAGVGSAMCVRSPICEMPLEHARIDLRCLARWPQRLPTGVTMTSKTSMTGVTSMTLSLAHAVLCSFPYLMCVDRGRHVAASCRSKTTTRRWTTSYLLRVCGIAALYTRVTAWTIVSLHLRTLNAKASSALVRPTSPHTAHPPRPKKQASASSQTAPPPRSTAPLLPKTPTTNGPKPAATSANSASSASGIPPPHTMTPPVTGTTIPPRRVDS